MHPSVGATLTVELARRRLRLLPRRAERHHQTCTVRSDPTVQIHRALGQTGLIPVSPGFLAENPLDFPGINPRSTPVQKVFAYRSFFISLAPVLSNNSTP